MSVPLLKQLLMFKMSQHSYHPAKHFLQQFLNITPIVDHLCSYFLRMQGKHGSQILVLSA